MNKCKECGQEVKDYWKVGDYIYFDDNGVVKVLSEDGDSENSIWVWRAHKTFLGRCFGHEGLKDAADGLEFYAPPTEEQLESWGKVIDRIGVVDEDDDKTYFVNYWGGLDNGTGGSLSRKYNGLRYILKDAPVDTVIKDNSELIEAIKSAVSELNHVIEVMEEK